MSNQNNPPKPVPNPVRFTIDNPQIPTVKAMCKLCNRVSDGSIFYHMVNRHSYSLARGAAKYGTIDVEMFKDRVRTLNLMPDSEEFFFMKEFVENNSTPLVDNSPPLIKKHQRLRTDSVAKECDGRQEKYIPSDWYRPEWERKKRERGEL